MKDKILTLSALIFIGYTIPLNAQCAMCKAVVETNLENGGNEGIGLNNGILYLMAIPYLAAISFGVFYYLQNKKTKAPSN